MGVGDDRNPDANLWAARTGRRVRDAKGRTKRDDADEEHMLGTARGGAGHVTLLTRPEIGMTNNPAERSLRHAVLWRRTSFGSQSESGAETVARLLTVVMTMRSRGEIAHRFLVDTFEAAHAGRAGPSLVPVGARQAESRAP